MRVALAFALLLVSHLASAQTPQVTRVDVTEYGIYTADLVKAEPAPGSPAGTEKIVTHMRLATQTRTVPAAKGTSFGYRFVVAGSPAGVIAPLHMVTTFPASMTNPATHQSSTRSESDIGVSIGAIGYAGYSMDDDWEVLPGVWTFQIWSQGRKLAEQSFTVQKP